MYVNGNHLALESLKKCRLGPQNGLESLGPEKPQKNNQETATMDNCFEPVEQVGGHRYPFLSHPIDFESFIMGLESRVILEAKHDAKKKQKIGANLEAKISTYYWK